MNTSIPSFTRLFALTALVGIIGLGAGCGLGKTTIKLSPRAPTFTDKVAGPTVINVEKLKDCRGIDPFLLSCRGAGGATENYVTDRQLAEIVTDSLKGTLHNLGCNVQCETGDFTLSGDLLKFDSMAQVGNANGEVETSVLINLKLTYCQTGGQPRHLWGEVVSGNTKQAGVPLDNANIRRKVAESALNAAMTNLANSQGFRKALASSRR